MNQLYFGDSLDILKRLHVEHPNGFIDLVYIDPPFNSKRNYNVLFETVDLHDAKAQKEAFSDTWSNVSYKDTINELSRINLDLYNFLSMLDSLRISQSAVSYLTTMAIRIHYIHKVLKPSGSLYLHCDSNMSHYLKLVCDLIFGEKHFINEIIWQRTNNPKGSQFEPRKFGVSTDTILLYSKTKDYLIKVDAVRIQLTEEELAKKYPNKDEKGSYLTYPIVRSASKGERPNLVYDYKGYTPEKWGWVVKKEKLVAIDERGDLGWTSRKTPFRKYRPEEDRGMPIYNLWDDIHRIQSQSDESLGYPTQKPVALLERIIKASSNEGDLVGDFFCGCGTTVAAAQKLNRQWIGVDISHLAVGLIRKRLIDTYGDSIIKSFIIDGLPKDVGSAKSLALQPQGRMHFQDWVIESLLGGVSNVKKTGDGGYDGYTTLEIEQGKKEIVLIEVKSGNINISTLRSFAKTVQQQKGSAGILVCFNDQVTKGMLSEAKGEGYLREDIYGNRYDKIQILTVEALLEGKMPDLPKSTETGPFKKADRDIKKDKSIGFFD